MVQQYLDHRRILLGSTMLRLAQSAEARPPQEQQEEEVNEELWPGRPGLQDAAKGVQFWAKVRTRQSLYRSCPLAT